MYDRVVLTLYRNQIPDSYNFDWTSVINNPYVTNRNYGEDGDSGTGFYRGKWIKADNDKVIFVGSLSKCLFGNNIETLTMAQTRDVIEGMTKELGVPMQYAVVESVEFSTNFSMSRPPIEYQIRMGGAKGMAAFNIKGTQYLDSKDVKIKMYDKMQEAKKKREISSKESRAYAQYLLRYETTFNKKAMKKMFGRELVASDLWSKRVFWGFVAEWFRLYEDIEKRADSALDISFDDLRGLSDLYNWCICVANERQNLPYYTKQNLFRNRPNPTGNDRQRHCAIQGAFKKANAWGKEHLKSGLIEELDACFATYLTWLLEESPDSMTIKEQELLFG